MPWKTRSSRSAKKPSCKEDNHESVKLIHKESPQISFHFSDCNRSARTGDFAGAGQFDKFNDLWMRELNHRCSAYCGEVHFKRESPSMVFSGIPRRFWHASECCTYKAVQVRAFRSRPSDDFGHQYGRVSTGCAVSGRHIETASWCLFIQHLSLRQLRYRVGYSQA